MGCNQSTQAQQAAKSESVKATSEKFNNSSAQTKSVTEVAATSDKPDEASAGHEEKEKEAVTAAVTAAEQQIAEIGDAAKPTTEVAPVSAPTTEPEPEPKTEPAPADPQPVATPQADAQLEAVVAATAEPEPEPEPVATKADAMPEPITSVATAEDEQEEEEDENAEDISLLMKIVATQGLQGAEMEEAAQKAASSTEYEFMQLFDFEQANDVWFVYDTAGHQVDSLTIGFYSAMHATEIKVSTATEQAGDYTAIADRSDIKQGEKATVLVKSKHERFIKVAIRNRLVSGMVAVNVLKFRGFENSGGGSGGGSGTQTASDAGASKEVTDRVKIYQGYTPSFKEADVYNCLKNNDDVTTLERGLSSWIIFDCKRYEIERVQITFEPYCVPQIVNFKLSDVAPRYSFKIPAAKQFELGTVYAAQGDAGWSRVSLVHDLEIPSECYTAQGFKRYACLQFGRYYADEMKIRRIRFYGKKSTQISEDDEQFQERFDGAADAEDGDEEQKDDGSPRQWEVVDHAASMQGMPIANMWKAEDHFFWMCQYGSQPFITIDVGNNAVQTILVKAYATYVYKTLKISTHDKAKAKGGWTVIVEDNEMETKMTDGGEYDLTQCALKKFIKIEMFDAQMTMYGLSTIKLYGDGPFLDKKERVVTMDDIRNMKFKDQDLVQAYTAQLQKKQVADIQQIAMKTSQMTTLSDEWMAAKKAWCEAEMRILWAYTEPTAYLADTIYERDLRLQAMEKQKSMCDELAALKLEKEVAMEKSIAACGPVDASNAEKIGQIRTEWSEYLPKMTEEWHTKIFAIWRDPQGQAIWAEFKKCVQENPRKLSSSFTAVEYENAVTQYASRFEKEELRKCYHKMADLFDECIAEKTEKMHKFLVYLLNAASNYLLYARSWAHGMPPVTIVLDTTSLMDKAVKSIAFAIDQTYANTIEIFTADELREQKADDEDVDDVAYDYSNFQSIGKLSFSGELLAKKQDKSNVLPLSLDDTKVVLNGPVRQFLKIEFKGWDEKSNFFSLMAKQIVFEDDGGSVVHHGGVKAITANKPCGGQSVENLLSTAEHSMYYTQSIGQNHQEMIEDTIRDEVCRGVNMLRKSRGATISKHDKHFLKFLLCFRNKRNYDEMLYSSKLVMGLLRKPLDVEYKRLQDTNAGILSLKLDGEYRSDKSIQSNHQLLEWAYGAWYKPKTAMFWPDDLKPLADEWTQIGLNVTDPTFSQMKRTSTIEPDKSYVPSDDVAMDFLNLIAYKVDPAFQREMKELFKQNREKLGRTYPTGDRDLAVQSGPVKTKARQKIKVDLKYFVKPAPQSMAVLDIVRCGIVCEDSEELCSLYKLIMERFKGNILRVKNAFDDVKKGDDSHGYRAVMININFGDDEWNPKYRMVCEAQLLLNSYYQVRKDMHLGYGICRSEDGGKGSETEPYIVLARDCAKFGNLEI